MSKRCFHRSITLITCLFVYVSVASGNEIRLLIVVPDRWADSLESYVSHKRQRHSAEILKLSSVVAKADGNDDAEKLKRTIFDRWKQDRITHVLLVGEADCMPVRYMVLDRNTEAAFNYAFYPSDLYYADLAKADGSFESWNAAKEGFHAGYFGEVRGEHNKSDPINFDQIDYKPEIAIGRWPVRNEEELKFIAAKTILFDDQSQKESLRKPRAAIVAVGGWVDMRDRFDRLATSFHGWEIHKRFYKDRRRDYNTPPPNEKEVHRLFESGSDLIVHGGHGDDDSWHKCLKRSNLPSSSQNAHPIVISAGCSTARLAPLPPYENYVDEQQRSHTGTYHGASFEKPPPAPSCYQPKHLNRDGLGKSMIRESSTNTVVYIGCNTGSQPCGLTLVDGFTAALLDQDVQTVGEAWSQAVSYYYDKERLRHLKPTDSWYPPSIFFQGMKFMFFGDPTLTIPAIWKNGSHE